MPTLVFDYDGTIQESLKTYAPAVRETAAWLRAQGVCIEEPAEEKISSWLGLRNEEMWAEFAPGLAAPLRAQGALRIGQAMQRLVKDGTDPWFAGSREALDQLKEGGFSMIVLSNCDRAYAQFNEEAFTMHRWFSEYIDCESHGGKSKAEILAERIAKERAAGCGDGRYLVIGDRASDREAAHRNGLPFIGCRYGYAREGELDGAEAYADSVRELPALVQKLL